MLTSDRVTISDGLRVWAMPGAEPATVDLETLVHPAGAGLVAAAALDRGRSEVVPTTTISTRHPDTGERPPNLGTCQWVGTCTTWAVRMQPPADGAGTGLPNLPLALTRQ